MIQEQLPIATVGVSCTKIVPAYDRPACELGPLARLELGIRDNCAGCPVEGSLVGKTPHR